MPLSSLLFCPRKAREPEVFTESQFGDVDDLTGVIGEVFDDVSYSLKPCNAETLDGVHVNEFMGIQFFEHLAGFDYRTAKPGLERAPGHGTALRKLLIALASVRLTAQAGDDPLTDVAGKMKRQVPRTV